MLRGGTRFYGWMTLPPFGGQAERTHGMLMISANLDRAPIRALPYPPEQTCFYHLSSAVLLAVRDWLTATETVDLARNLPDALVPVIFKGWIPQSDAPPRPKRAQFIARVEWYLGETAVAECQIAKALMDFVPYLPARLFLSNPPAQQAVHAGEWEWLPVSERC